jgi:hypothetical protein
MVTALYNAYLSLFFLSMVTSKTKQRERRNSFRRTSTTGISTDDVIPRWEWLGHGICWIFPLSTQIPAVILESFNMSVTSRTCGIIGSPNGCDPDANECDRGLYALLFGDIVLYTVLTGAIVGIIATVMVFWSYRRQIRNSQRLDASQTLTSQRKEMLSRVTFRATFYCLAYVNTFLWPFIYSLLINLALSSIGNDEPIPNGVFAFNVFSCTLFPLQGFFNYILYTRHETRELSKVHPDAHCCEVGWRVWKGEKAASSQGSY